MANTLLSPTIITRKALAVLHQEAEFLATINKEYDSRFANGGASPSGKIGPSLLIRNPNQFAVRSGSVLDVQDITEESQTLTVSTQKGVDFSFPTSDLTLTIDDFSERYIQPAISVLAAVIENDVYSNVYKDIYNLVDGDAAGFDFVHLSTAQEKMNDNLAPRNPRYAMLKNSHVNKFNVASKGLYNPAEVIGKQFKAGVMGRVCDFDIMASTHAGKFQTGTCAKTTGYTVNGAAEEGSHITIQSGSNTFKKGDIVTLAGCYRCHPETKVDTGVLQQFVVTADNSGGAGELYISPSIVVSGAKQNVTDYPDDSGAIVKVGAGASELLDMSMGYHRDAFTFVTADLEDVSKFGAWGARANLDGISMRIARQWDIVNDKVPCRIDILYGYKTIRPELACRIHADG